VGGLGLFLAFAMGLGLSFTLPVDRFGIETERLLLLLAGSGLLVGVMFYDDAVGLGPLPKLAWQLIATAIVIGPRLRGGDHGIVISQINWPFGDVVTLPLLVAIPVTLLWIVVFVNALNWVDGLDGLAATVTLVACGVLFLHTYFFPPGNPQFTISLLPLILGAAVVGFLPFNWPPARLFMGDAGAQFLGFALAIIAIIGGAKIATAVLALGLPLADVVWVILYRVFHGRSPLQADRGHLHHRLLDRGWKPERIVLFVAGGSAAFGMSALLLPTRQLKLAAIIVLGLTLLGTIALLAYRDRE
jgi:UDP-N-acetylmuramyl pentapeptide phosphotransferase/UDP-N-acetylglucosamine-1-phosphate transferase